MESAVATNNSRMPAVAMKRNAGRVRKLPPRMTAPTAARVTTAVCQPFNPSTRLIEAPWPSPCPSPWSELCALPSTVRSDPWADARSAISGMARSGITARNGMTAISCVSKTEKLDSPPRLFSNPFSPSVCKTIAVDDKAMIRPMASATDQGWPKPIATAITAPVVSAICPPPSPRSCVRMLQRCFGSSSSPMRKSIITTPNSANCWICTTSTPSSPRTGLIRMPAIR